MEIRRRVGGEEEDMEERRGTSARGEKIGRRVKRKGVDVNGKGKGIGGMGDRKEGVKSFGFARVAVTRGIRVLLVLTLLLEGNGLSFSYGTVFLT